MEINLMQTIGAFIKEKREALGWTQAELSIRLYGTDNRRGYISMIESGKRKQLNVQTLEYFLVALNCNISFVELAPPVKTQITNQS